MDFHKLTEKYFSKDRLETGSSKLSQTNMLGTAISDSENGYVKVLVGGDVTYPDDSPADGVYIATGPYVKTGDQVHISLNGGTGKSPTITNAVGWGDAIHNLADQAKEAAEIAQGIADDAYEAAVNANETATEVEESINNQFWVNENGAHITITPQDIWDDPNDPAYHAGPNTLVNSEGILLRNGDIRLAQFTPDGLSIYDGVGNSAITNTVAQYTSTAARIGKLSENHVAFNPDGMLIQNGTQNVASFNREAAIFYDDTGEKVAAQFGTAGATIGTDSSSQVIINDSQIGFNNKDGQVNFSVGDSSQTITEYAWARVPYFRYRLYQGRYTSNNINDSPTEVSINNLVAGSTVVVGGLVTPNGTSFITGETVTFTAGTADSTGKTFTGSFITYKDSSANGQTTISVKVTYAISNGVHKFTFSVTWPTPQSSTWPWQFSGYGKGGGFGIRYFSASALAPYFSYGTRYGNSVGAFSATLGQGLMAEYSYNVAIGRYNENLNALFAIGYGSNNNDRRTLVYTATTGNTSFVSYDLDDGSAPTENTTGIGIMFRDQDRTMLGSIRPRIYSDGSQCLQIYAHTMNGSASKYNVLELGFLQDLDRTRKVTLSEYPAWHDALNLGCVTAWNYAAISLTGGSNNIIKNLAQRNRTPQNSAAEAGEYAASGYIALYKAGYYIVSASARVSGVPYEDGIAIRIYYARNGTTTQIGEYITNGNSLLQQTVHFPQTLVLAGSDSSLYFTVRTSHDASIAVHNAIITVTTMGGNA